MADEVFTNVLGGIIMLLVIQGYLIYLRVRMHQGKAITRPQRAIFIVMCLVALLAAIVHAAQNPHAE